MHLKSISFPHFVFITSLQASLSFFPPELNDEIHAVHHIRHDTLLLPVQRPRLRNRTLSYALRRMQGIADHRNDNIRRTGADGGDSDTAELLQRGEPVAAGLDSDNHRFEPRAVGARGMASRQSRLLRTQIKQLKHLQIRR